MSFVRVQPPAAKFLNKAVIVSLIAACLFIVGFAVIDAFRVTPQTNTHFKISSRQISLDPDHNIALLPNYSNAAAIDRLLNRHRGPIGRTPAWAFWLQTQLQQMATTQQQMFLQAQTLTS